jgi:ABC-type Fe3+-hydroxamate transport system substrate-binding protein
MNSFPSPAPPIQVDKSPSRIVSLLPSMTRNVMDLGGAERLVGITDYCPENLGDPSTIARIGGPKTPAVEKIIALKPDLVLANWEENEAESVQALEKAGLTVWVTLPRSTVDSMDVLWALAGLLRLESKASARLHSLQKTLDWALSARETNQLVRTFCPIWQDKTEDGLQWWMTFNQETYAHDVLACCGGENIFADRMRRYPIEADLGRNSEEDPGVRDQRYPRVMADEITEKQPQIILLPDEPFRFSSKDVDLVLQELADTPAVMNNNIHLIKGALVTWHGTYLAHALAQLPGYFAPPQ